MPCSKGRKFNTTPASIFIQAAAVNRREKWKKGIDHDFLPKDLQIEKQETFSGPYVPIDTSPSSAFFALHKRF